MWIAEKKQEAQVSTLESKLFQQIYKLKTAKPIDAKRKSRILPIKLVSIAKGIQGIKEGVHSL